jgi:hypothetical protein
MKTYFVFSSFKYAVTIQNIQFLPLREKKEKKEHLYYEDRLVSKQTAS